MKGYPNIIAKTVKRMHPKVDTGPITALGLCQMFCKECLVVLLIQYRLDCSQTLARVGLGSEEGEVMPPCATGLVTCCIFAEELESSSCTGIRIELVNKICVCHYTIIIT